MLATEGKSNADFVTYGPYLALAPGQYRVTYRYQYLAPPKPEQAATYDVCSHADNQPDESTDSAPLPCPDTKPQVFTDTFTVTRSGWNYEMRIYYHGSGTLRVDSLAVTRLTP
jgi:hypothetical protein